jgi:aryl-alcohol dehydrogenase-like predicted oxidoreductase
MKKRNLWAGGPSVGAIGLGCMNFGGLYGPATETESLATLARAVDLGIDHFDIADIYGAGYSETLVGRFLRDSGARVSIATKAGVTRKRDRPFDNSPEYLRSCLEASLRRLGVDHIDLYYVHRREAARPIEDVIDTMARFKAEGKIGAIGLSEVSPATLERACAVHPVAAVQAEYSLWTRLPELGMVQACARAGASLVAFSPLGRGALTDTPPDPADFHDADFRRTNPRFLEPNYSYNLRRIRPFIAHAARMGHSAGQLALAWLLARGPHVIPIPGTRSAAHLGELAAADGIVLGPEDIEAIEALLPVGFAHGERYDAVQAISPEGYC